MGFGALKFFDDCLAVAEKNVVFAAAADSCQPVLVITFFRIILATFQDSFVHRVSANPKPMINVISQQGERAVIFRDSGRPKWPDFFELQ